ncbi:hypothetical protein N9W17_04330 [Jannaschia sp.]|nr:hypothetical protein [Jannaschia sp.]
MTIFRPEGAAIAAVTGTCDPDVEATEPDSLRHGVAGAPTQASATGTNPIVVR